MEREMTSDELFYEELCNKYFHSIYNYCNKLVKGQMKLLDFVEESTQNTFLAAQKQISKLKNHPNVEGWLYTTGKNLINHSYRNMYIKKKRETYIDNNFLTYYASLDQNLENIFNSIVDIDELCVNILEQLKPCEQQLYKDYYKRNMSISEISKKYHISESATTTRIYRLKKKIKHIVHRYFKEIQD